MVRVFVFSLGCFWSLFFGLQERPVFLIIEKKNRGHFEGCCQPSPLTVSELSRERFERPTDHGDRLLDLRFGFETDKDRPALERLAARLHEAGALTADWPLRFSWNRLPGALPGDWEFEVRRRRFLARQGDEVRGTVNLLESELSLAGRAEMISFAWSQGLVSESLVDRRYCSVPVALLRATLALQPRQMQIGRVGTEASSPRLLIALGWRHEPVPVLVLPIRTARVARELRRLSRYPKLRAMVRSAANLGMTSLIDVGLSALRRVRRPRNVGIDQVQNFSNWSDEVWTASRPHYGALARRDGAALDRLYRPGDTRLIRVRLSESGRPMGWVAVTVHDNIEDPDYGDLRVGAVADCLAKPREAAATLAAGVERLADDGVDLIRATFSHPAWISAARRTGFVQVPTATRFFASPAIAAVLPPVSAIHLTLGDNDGPLPHDPAIDERETLEVERDQRGSSRFPVSASGGTSEGACQHADGG